MPRYDYRCERCTELFEVEHPADGPRRGFVKCPVCGTGETVKIILQTPAIKIRWRDARSSSDAAGLKPRFLKSTRNKKHDEITAALGGA